VSVKTVWKLTRECRIPCLKVGRWARYDFEDVKAALLKRPRGYTVVEAGRRMLVAGQLKDGWHVGMATVHTARYLTDALKRVRPPTKMLGEFAPTLRYETLLRLKKIRPSSERAET
jgi:hypothetical protein